ncbi:Mov34/MPN/PAD-1 family protein [Gimesia chilikensis]|uniref:Mov34/MPN/PAD-1 family protein n=1 Tax=Gimesia chilikensis TaxID=2605989 RepID=UPI0011A1D0DC|nr:Mov34/MPN/PAD-1 family protein [Gimesia chilikensis]|tara:strand:+ start:6074 stop:6577 length:504 start_codon:yes stop_codon:yes gene_type:complete
MSQLIDKPDIIWIGTSTVTELISECEKTTPNETGGVLMGYWGSPKAEPVITHVIGPGPAAIHEPCRFVPDHDYQLNEIARVYELSQRTLCYLGDWHSHPGGTGNLSYRDLLTLRRIANSHTARVDYPLMLIVSGGSKWELNGWQYEIHRKWFWSFSGIRSMQITTYE